MLDYLIELLAILGLFLLKGLLPLFDFSLNSLLISILSRQNLVLHILNHLLFFDSFFFYLILHLRFEDNLRQLAATLGVLGVEGHAQRHRDVVFVLVGAAAAAFGRVAQG